LVSYELRNTNLLAYLPLSYPTNLKVSLKNVNFFLNDILCNEYEDNTSQGPL